MDASACARGRTGLARGLQARGDVSGPDGVPCAVDAPACRTPTSRRPGLAPFVAAAALLHGALSFRLTSSRRSSPPAPPSASPPEGLIDLTFEPDEAPATGPVAAPLEGLPAPSAPPESVPPHGVALAPPATKTEPGRRHAVAAETGANAAAPTDASERLATTDRGSDAGGAMAETAAPREAPRAIDFSLGRLAPGWGVGPPASAPPPAPPVDPGARARRELSRVQDQHDADLGLGWAGNALNALYTTDIRNSAPPGEGDAVIEVELGPDGRPKGARVLSGTGGVGGWQRLSDLLATALEQKPRADLGGARGARVTVAVRVTERLPDGSKPVYGLCGAASCLSTNVGAKVVRLLRASLVRAERL